MDRSEETILSVLARHVKERPDHELFHWVDKQCNVSDTLLNKQLWDNSCAVAQLLEAQGVKQGDRVMIVYPLGLEFLSGLVGCMMAGVIGCSVYPPNPKQLSTDLPPFNLKVADAGAKFALTSTSFRRIMALNSFIGNKTSVTWLATDYLRAPSEDWSPIDVSPDEVAFIQYTSGSTGFPKGVMISHRSLLYNASFCAETSTASSVTDPEEKARFTTVGWVPQYHDMGLLGFFFSTIYAGTRGVACSPMDFILHPILWHDMMVKFQAHTTLGPNFSFGLLVKRLLSRKKPFEKWSFVNRVVCGAEPVDPAVMDKFMKVLAPKSLHVGYGLAEMGLGVCYSPYSVLDGLVACGDILKTGRAKVCIVNEARAPVKDGTIGEVCVYSPQQVALGYWGNSDATLSTFACQIAGMDGDWLATGDLGQIVNERLYITGRKKELIILNGRNFFPVDIERLLEKTYPECIRPGCTVAYQHSSQGVGIVADIRKGVGKEALPKAHELASLISVECNVAVEYICLLKAHGIPKTTSGKLKRTQVKDTSIASTWPENMTLIEWCKPQQRDRRAKDLSSSVDVKTQATIESCNVATAQSSAGDIVEMMLQSETSSSTHTCKALPGSIEEDVVALISQEVGRNVDTSCLLDELGLTSLVVSSLHASLVETFELIDDELPVSIFFEGNKTIGYIVEKVQEAHRGCDQYHHQEERGKELTRVRLMPHSQPIFDACMAVVLQAFAVASQAVFVACTLYLPIFCSLVMRESLDQWGLLLLVPVLIYLHALASTLLLLLVKWVLVGRQRADYTAVWSARFAARWVVKKYSQLVWTFTLWGLCGDTEILNTLHRLLGCKIGAGVSIEPGCIIDYDLVEVGDGTSIGAGTVINTHTVSLGVQTIGPVVIGSDCAISDNCIIERQSTLHNGVRLEHATLVAPFSTLLENSSWHGKPAERIEAPDIETGESSVAKEENLSASTTPKSSGCCLSHLDVVRLLTVLVVAPYLWSIEFGIAIFVGSEIHRQLGYFGLAGLIWVPPTTVCVILFAVGIAAKKLLLGSIKPSVWPVGGSFHARKYLVDHLIIEHALRWRGFSSNTGSCIAHSSAIERYLLRCLGVKIGMSTSLFSSDECWTKYDLLSIGSRVVVAGFVKLSAWRTTDESFVGETITISDDCFVGAYTVVLGGTELARGCTAASFSIVSEDVEGGQTVVGTKKYKSTMTEGYGEGWTEWTRETAMMVGIAGVWLAMSLFVSTLFVVAERSDMLLRVGRDAGSAETAMVTACLVGAGFFLVLPIYFLFMMWAGKTIIVGRITPAEIANTSHQLFARYAWGPAFLIQYLKYTIQVFGGTIVENCQWASLGAQIGSNTYLDTVLMYEPDLVTIGDWTSVSETALTTHTIGRQAHVYSPLTIGNRCTVGRRCNVQVACLEDDCEMVAFTMPLTGSRVKSGTWIGYPARRAGPATQPLRPPNSALFTLLCNPWSTLVGCAWFLTLPVCFAWRRVRQIHKPGTTCTTIPRALQGTFSSEESGLEINFCSAEWLPTLRILRVPAGEYTVGWWTMAGYEFDLSNDQEYVGRVSLCWWSVPMSIVTAKLCIDGNNNLLWSHSWFSGDPEDKMRFKRTSPPVKVTVLHKGTL